MEEKKIIKKIVTKIIIIILLMVILLLQYIYFSRKTYENTNSTLNTADARMDFDYKTLVYRDIDYFFKYLQKKEYNKAFDLLSKECKTNVFANSESDFESQILKIINTDICEKKVRYDTLTEEKEKGKKIYIVKGIIYFEKMNENFKGNLNTSELTSFFAIKNFTFKVKEIKPFDFEYYFSLE